MLAQRQELERRRFQLKKAMQQLQERERSILAARRLAEEPLTLEDLSRQFGISRERVRQIEARAVEKLQRLMNGGRRAPAYAGLKRKPMPNGTHRHGKLKEDMATHIASLRRYAIA